MNVSPSRHSVSRKAVWGRAILGALFAMLLLPAGSEAAGPQHGKITALSGAKQAVEDSRQGQHYRR